MANSVDEKDGSSKPSIEASQLEPEPAVKPFSGHFSDKTEAAAKARWIYVKILVQRTCLIIIAIYAIFSIYWGAVSRLPARSLEGWIVDFDGGRIGQTIAADVEKLSGPAIHWKVLNASEFTRGVEDLVHAVIQEQCWVAIAINEGSTVRLDAALDANAGNTYNGSTVITAYGLEARNENAFRTLLRPTLDSWLQQIAHDFAIQMIQDLASNSSVELPNLNPEVLVRPVYYTLQNLRPFDVPVATAITFIGLIYLLILSFFVVNSGILARGVSGLENSLSTTSLILLRIVSPTIIYLVLALFYSLHSKAFQVPFDRTFGRGGFLIFWMVSWFGMTAAGLALETMTTLLTVKFVPFFLILWVVSNVSVCLWPIDTLPEVYKYGHAAPFYQISRAVRAVVFGTKNEIGLNFGILAVWIIISCITLPLIQWYRRREVIRKWVEQQNADEEHPAKEP